MDDLFGDGRCNACSVWTVCYSNDFEVRSASDSSARGPHSGHRSHTVNAGMTAAIRG
jgi:hypothetical protein